MKKTKQERRSCFKAWGPALVPFAVLLLLAARPVFAGSWTALATNAPGSVQLMLLLSDGSVLCHNSGSNVWYKLTPSAIGSYTNGSWTTMASMADTRLYMSSQVLRDGRVLVAGGEYGSGGTTAEVYDPLANSWTYTPSAGQPNFSDSASMMLPDGKVLVSPVLANTFNGTAIYDPVANTWTNGPASLFSQNEATWVKLPDDSFITVDKNSTTSERYIPSLNQWIADANVPTSLYGNGAEIGPGFLLPDGRAFFLGGSGNTAFYTPTGTTNNGSWAAGPPLPDGQACPDAPGAMLVNRNVLFACSPVATGTNVFTAPTSFYEYNPFANAYIRQFSPVGGLTENIPCYQATMLDLPDGTVLYSDGSAQLYVYTPVGGPLAADKPTIYSATVNPGGSFHLTGTLLNGISAGASYGDDWQMDSNYPLIRFGFGGNVYYGRTYNWSSTGVATGDEVVSTEFTLPTTVYQNGPQPYSMVTVANGIASDPVTFYGPVWVDFDYGGLLQLGTFNFPFPTMAQGVSAVPANGTILIKPGHSLETMRLATPMKIAAVGGSAIIGR